MNLGGKTLHREGVLLRLFSSGKLKQCRVQSFDCFSQPRIVEGIWGVVFGMIVFVTEEGGVGDHYCFYPMVPVARMIRESKSDCLLAAGVKMDWKRSIHTKAVC